MAGLVAPAPPCTFSPKPCVLRDGRERFCGLAVLGISQCSRLTSPLLTLSAPDFVRPAILMFPLLVKMPVAVIGVVMMRWRRIIHDHVGTHHLVILMLED